MLFDPRMGTPLTVVAMRCVGNTPVVAALDWAPLGHCLNTGGRHDIARIELQQLSRRHDGLIWGTAADWDRGAGALVLGHCCKYRVGSDRVLIIGCVGGEFG